MSVIHIVSYYPNESTTYVSNHKKKKYETVLPPLEPICAKILQQQISHPHCRISFINVIVEHVSLGSTTLFSCKWKQLGQ
jgi:hypothetical protein